MATAGRSPRDRRGVGRAREPGRLLWRSPTMCGSPSCSPTTASTSSPRGSDRRTGSLRRMADLQGADRRALGAAKRSSSPATSRRRRSCARPSICSTPVRLGSPRWSRAAVVVHPWLKQAILLLFRLSQDQDRRARPVRVRRQAAAQDAASRSMGVRVVPGRVGSLWVVPRPRRRDDAELREHRRPRRAQHDGRHVGDRGLVRTDRRERPSLGRGRHRRSARAAPGRAGHRRGRLPHRQPLHRGRGRSSRERQRARRRLHPHRLDPGHRRADGVRDRPGRGAGALRRGHRHAASASSAVTSSACRACS